MNSHSRKNKKSRSIGRILLRDKLPYLMAAIPLGNALLHYSCHLPAHSASRLIVCLLGVAPGGGYRVSPDFILAEQNRLVSVALFLALYLAAFSVRPLAVTLLYGVRTFLCQDADTSNSGCPICFIHYDTLA